MKHHPCLLLPLLLAACATEPARTGMNRGPVKSLEGPSTQKDENPSLDLWTKLRSGAPAAPEMEAMDARYLASPGAPLRTLACMLPRDTATDRAWKLVDENALPTATRALWHANGLRLGFLPEAKWEEFRQAVNASEKNAKTNAGVLTQELSAFTLRAVPEPLRKGGRMPGRVVFPLDTTLPPFAPALAPVTAFEGDRVQLLATGAWSGSTLSGISLVPHLHHPQSLLGESLQTLDAEGKPRSLKPWEKELQGQTLAALATPTLMPPKGQVLVLGLWWPWKKSAAEIKAEGLKMSEAEKAVAESGRLDKKPKADKKKDGQTAEEDLRLRNTPPPMPLTLGRALFTLTQGNGEFQVILVVGVR